MAPRGRPRKPVDGSVSNTTAAAATRCSGRSSLAAANADSIDPLSVATKNGPSSVSSMSKSPPHNESTGYSTPATSDFATPAPEAIPISTSATRGRGHLCGSVAKPTPGMSAVARAAALRNSQYALNASASKRKREFFHSEEDDDLIDNSTDAQLARALQKEEDGKSSEMAFNSIEQRPRKAVRPLSKIDFADNSDDEMDAIINAATGRSKNVQVQLGARGSNKVSFNPVKNKKKFFQDSDLDSKFLDSESELEDFADSDDGDFVVDSKSLTATSRHCSSPRTQRMPPPPPKKSSKAKAFKSTLKNTTNKNSIVSKPISKTTDVKNTTASDADSDLTSLHTESEFGSLGDMSDSSSDDDIDDIHGAPAPLRRPGHSHNRWNAPEREGLNHRGQKERDRLEKHHPELHNMWKDLENLPKIGQNKIEQPKNINRQLKPFQLEGVAWMKAMEKTEWGGGLLGDEMGMGKTIQAVSLIMSDWPAKQPTLVLIPPVALMQWQQEIADYTDGTLKTLVYHGTNLKTKTLSLADLKKYDVILISYNSLESMYRKQEKGFKRKAGLHKEKSTIHQIQFHRVILDEAHNIKSRTTGCAKACFALKADHKWCLSGTPLQNRIGELFSLVRFLDIRPFACYFCKQCSCSSLNWTMNSNNRCKGCNHGGMQHVSVFNQELLNPIIKYGSKGPGKLAFGKLRILTDRFMLRRVKRDHSSAMELPAKEIYVDRQFFGEEENDFAGSIMNSGTRKFETYVAQGVMLNNYANIFGLIMQMRQVADHPDLILKKNVEGGQNVLVCCICDEAAENAIRSSCRHEFCRECAKNYLHASESPDCPTCHIPLAIDLEMPSIEQDEQAVKKSSIINRIKMENWTSSSKIEALVHDLHELRSKNMSSKSIIFSQFTTMLQLVEWRLRRAGITTVMLDGSMTPAQRQASINHFMADVNVECFLVSLKAGGVALNLTEASKVFIVDPWWNPAAEWQSADRCHRIGQARPCSITRLCIEDSVESRMVLLQEKKANMINSTINADDAAMESLTPEDMQFLFRGS
ncbi:DNA repair protein RAD16 [Calycina marina]|uniref:DNA repair protein RAD16 n=1 Tax=Calycina marina TaxID=1763456 RepID=A0A9P7Z027_9HELO|nr:DNA repair protein RAD16 [Calycina marina]